MNTGFVVAKLNMRNLVEFYFYCPAKTPRYHAGLKRGLFFKGGV
jgi:hypothetical protein